MTPSQYEREFATVSDSSERVEYAVKLPGQTEGDYICLANRFQVSAGGLLPLEDAYESGDKDQIDLHRKNLLVAINVLQGHSEQVPQSTWND